MVVEQKMYFLVDDKNKYVTEKIYPIVITRGARLNYYYIPQTMANVSQSSLLRIYFNLQYWKEISVVQLIHIVNFLKGPFSGGAVHLKWLSWRNSSASHATPRIKEYLLRVLFLNLLRLRISSPRLIGRRIQQMGIGKCEGLIEPCSPPPPETMKEEEYSWWYSVRCLNSSSTGRQ